MKAASNLHLVKKKWGGHGYTATWTVDGFKRLVWSTGGNDCSLSPDSIMA